jgi:DNA repair protein RecN (Recombination protein N)
MLKNLVIKNYALIRELEMKPAHELNIITGETGAGKSIMLGAVGLLLGNRADTKALYDEAVKCVIEGVFGIAQYTALKQLFEEEGLDYEEESIIRREVSPSGKSRAFVNDTPVTLDILKRIGSFLMDVHSQHDTLLLGSNAYQLDLLDAFAGNKALKETYSTAYRSYKKAATHCQRLQQEALEIRKEADYNSFLLQELEAAQLEGLNQQEMEEELEKLEHAEEIKLKLGGVVQALEYAEPMAINSSLYDVFNELKHIGRYSEKYRQLAERLNSCVIELKDLSRELETEEQEIELDEEKTFLLQERLRGLFNLQQKHGVSEVEELLKLQQDLQARVSRVQNLDDEIAAAEQELQKKELEMQAAASRLSQSRIKIFDRFVNEVSVLLKDLGMPDARLLVEHRDVAPQATGTDEVNILFSANKGVKPQALKNVASGGEFSRLMFCIKYVLADKTALPTIVFDEIDTGISGEIALKMVRMMQEMARNHQVISISHLPQIAAKGDAHYFVYKDNSSARTFSRIKKLSEEERVAEIAKMIGGAKPSATAFESARELMTSP